jgi:hypothetical protein
MDKIIVVDELVKKQKIHEIKTAKGVTIKLHLETPSISRRKYIESVLYRNLKDIGDGELASHEFAERIIKNIIKKVEGIHISKGGQVVPWDVSFTNNKNEEMTQESYEILIQVLEENISEEDAKKLFEEYTNLSPKLTKGIKQAKKKI